VIALIGILLLIGIVKKNAIMMIDFALHVERTEGKNSTEAIYDACVMRFRPIMMTTMAALLGGLPLALGTGVGSELRRRSGSRLWAGSMLRPDVNALYNAGGLCVPGPLEPLDQAPSRRELESGRVALGPESRRFRALRSPFSSTVTDMAPTVFPA